MRTDNGDWQNLLASPMNRTWLDADGSKHVQVRLNGIQTWFLQGQICSEFDSVHASRKRPPKRLINCRVPKRICRRSNGSRCGLGTATQTARHTGSSSSTTSSRPPSRPRRRSQRRRRRLAAPSSSACSRRWRSWRPACGGTTPPWRGQKAAGPTRGRPRRRRRTAAPATSAPSVPSGSAWRMMTPSCLVGYLALACTHTAVSVEVGGEHSLLDVPTACRDD